MKALTSCIILCLFWSVSQASRLMFPILLPDIQSNIIVTAAPEHEKPCPPKYTNVLSNTSLFTLSEQQMLHETALDYKYVTTNSGPPGTVFGGIGLREWKFDGATKIFPVSYFKYTNHIAQVEIAFFGSRQLIASYRSKAGDGYNVNVIDGRLFEFQGYKFEKLDGLYVGQVFDSQHCNYWARFVGGCVVGKFLGWNERGEINMDAEFKEPFDFVKFEAVKFDLSWVKVP